MKLGMILGALGAAGCVLFAGRASAAAPTLTMGSTGLVYTADSLGNTISDFSYVGYKGGAMPIPTLAVKKIISPVAGDNTSNIQSAINTVAALPADANGFRGAVYLNAGTYSCSGTLSWGTSGVVLRGAGNSTIIQATGTSRTLVAVTGSGAASKTGSSVSITDSYVPGGTKTFHVSSTSGFGVGSNVITNCDYENPPTTSSTDPPAAYSLDGQLSLCAHCTANGIHYHLVVTQGGTAGPNVFVDCIGLGPGAGRDAGPHQRWASGVLFDRMTLISSDGVGCTIAMENRGNDGSGQGWAQGFSVEWNPQSPSISCQEPSYAVLAPQYNWCIGGIGGKKGAGSNGPWGEFQNFGALVQPSSLYLEQLRERLGSSALQNIGYARFSGSFKILNRNSGLAVNINGASTADNASIVQWPFSSPPTNAEWQFIDIGGGRFEIKNLNSGKALAASSSLSGAPIIQTTYTGNGLDQWIVTDIPPFAEIANKATGFALEVPGSSTANGTQLDEAVYEGGANQQFQILAAP